MIGGKRYLGHVPGLDGIRAVAVLLVVTTHFFLFFVPDKEFHWLAGGFLGVEIFFVLSGFLITSLLLGEFESARRISFRGFYRRRACRLLPALYVMLASYFVYVFATGQDLGVEVRSVIAAVLYVTNWLEVQNRTVTNSHLWSLAVEEQFYLVWPLVMVGLLRLRRSHAMAVVGVSVVALTIWTSVLWRPGTGFLLIERIYTRTDVQAVPILIGAFAAYAWSSRLTSYAAARAAAVPAALFVAVCAWHFDVTAGFYYDGGLALVSVATAVVILAVADGGWPALGWGPLRAVGKVSYGLYLWHIPVFYAVARSGASWSTTLQMMVALSVTAVVTAASWYLVEVPFLRLKRPRRSDSASPPASVKPSTKGKLPSIL